MENKRSLKGKTYFKNEIDFLTWYIKRQVKGINLEEAIERYESNPDFKVRVRELMDQENARRKSVRSTRAKKLGDEHGSINGKRNAESGLMREIQKVGCKLGGSANTESQKVARKKQIKEHFAPKGTAAAAEQKMAIYNEYNKKFYDLMPNDVWFNLKDAQHLADTQFDDTFLVEKFKFKFKVRNHMTKFTNTWYEAKKVGRELMYKKRAFGEN